MTLPSGYPNHYLPVKFFLSSYRALSDGRSGVVQLQRKLETKSLLASEWKITWIGTCAVLRTAIDLFKVDAKSCLSPNLRREFALEWKNIDRRREDHAIFWKFLREERGNILHEYEWRAYETWMMPDGTFREPHPIFWPVLRMRTGDFKGRNSLELLEEAADWVEARIFSAINRAGYEPEEYRGLSNFEPRPRLEATSGLLGFLANSDKDDDP
jgi:hypothetical protein